jgi:hypothetical protein
METITEVTQEELEHAIIRCFDNIGLEFAMHDSIPTDIHLMLIAMRKNFVAYVDNARLIKIQVKENHTL